MNQNEELAMAERHVRDGERMVEQQRILIADLNRDGHATDVAEELLAKFEATLTGFRDHLEIMRKEIRDHPFAR